MTTIVSIQSSVAYGHVGNSAATFPLMRLGCEVIPVLTVHFAASTIYGPPRGPLLTPDQVGDVMAGMDEHGFLAGVDAVLSGYQGAAAMGERILDSVRLVKERSPRALYCCDPVLGDEGRGFYVMPGIPEFMRDQVLPLADLTTPNHFELDFLSGRTTRTLAEIVDAARVLQARGPKTVVVTSAVVSDLSPHEIHMIAVDGDAAWKVTTPKLDRSFDGSGDVTAAMLLAHYLRTGSIETSLSATAGILYSLLAKTAEMGRRELALVAAQECFVTPPYRFSAERLG